MAQVPNYNPVPQATPQSGALPNISVNSPVEAFGGGSAQAMQGLGQTLDKVGNELFARAQALQQLKNDDEVDVKFSQYIQQSGELDNKFRLLSGNQPQEKLEEHVKALTELRETTSSGLSNPMAKRRFDTETRRRYSYDVINASNYAATQFKQYSKGTAASLRDVAIDQLVKDPYNDGLWNQVVKTVEETSAKESGLEGDGQVIADRKLQAALGRAVNVRAGAMSKSDPDKAQKFFDSVKDKLRAEDVFGIQETINDRGVKTNAALISNRLMGGDGSLIDRAMQATKAQESGGRYGNVTTTTNARTGRQQSALGAYGVMETNLGPWSKEILGKEVSKEEFLASRDIQDEIYRGKMGQYIQKYGVEGAGQAWLGGEGGVGKVDRKDAFGTTVGSYGQKFAQMVGPASAQSDEQRLLNRYEVAEKTVDKLYPPDQDPALNARARDAVRQAITTSASAQKRAYNIQVQELRNEIGLTLNTQNDKQRKPTSIAEARQIDPNIDAKLESLGKLDPTSRRRYENWFLANAKEDVPYSNERQMEYNRWVGMDDAGRNGYDANDAFNKGLLTSDGRNKILEGQAKSKHSAAEDIKVDAILRRHGDVLNAVKAYPSRTNAAANARYTQFRGALILELRAAQAEGGTQIKKPEDEDRIMQKLVGQQETGRNSRFLGIPIPGTTETKPAYEIESLQYPITVQSAKDVKALRPGQVYIYNGVKATVPK